MAGAARIQALRSNRNKMLETIYGSMSRMRLRGSKIGVPRILRSGALSEIGGLPMSQRKMIPLLALGCLACAGAGVATTASALPPRLNLNRPLAPSVVMVVCTFSQKRVCAIRSTSPGVCFETEFDDPKNWPHCIADNIGFNDCLEACGDDPRHKKNKKRK